MEIGESVYEGAIVALGTTGFNWLFNKLGMNTNFVVKNSVSIVSAVLLKDFAKEKGWIPKV